MSDLIERVLNQSMPGFARIANINKMVRWEEESQFALQAVKNSKRLQDCELQTIQDAIINVAAVGLTLNPAHGYAYLVPEAVKVGTEYRQVCQLRVSFKGLIKLAGDAGVAQWVRADVVKKNDTFTFNGAWNLPTHEMDPFGDRGPSIGVYCTIRTFSGDYLTEVAPWSEVLKAKAAAKTKNVWDQWEDEMAKKFIIKRAAKQWPKGGGIEHLSQAISVIDQYEGSEDLNKLDRIAASVLEALHGEYSDDEKGSMINEIWDELSESEVEQLWTAKTKGGWLEIKEKEEIRRLRSLAFENQKLIEQSAA
jgi:recombination protein RecT